MWKKKSSRGGGGHSRSTQESTTNTQRSGELSDSIEAAGLSGNDERPNQTQGSASIFKRLSGMEDPSGIEVTLEDLRTKLSGSVSGGRKEAKSSKGSRSPPSVFERLRSLPINSPMDTKTPGGYFLSKRRRLSGSDDRLPKKQKKGSSEKSGAGQSVFHRLGESGRGSGSKNIEIVSQSSQGLVATPPHSALVAVPVPDHFVRRIVLAKGNNVKEGLMGNFNPSRSI